jgi:hypothetical protein
MYVYDTVSRQKQEQTIHPSSFTTHIACAFKYSRAQELYALEKNENKLEIFYPKILYGWNIELFTALDSLLYVLPNNGEKF